MSRSARYPSCTRSSRAVSPTSIAHSFAAVTCATSTGCSGGKHKIPVTVGYVDNPTPPTAKSASTTLEAKCSK